MKGLSFSSLRVGERYSLTNYGEKFEFRLEEIISSDEFKLKDINSFETYNMSDLTKFGMGNDFEIRELLR